jgi:uncharacterized membrane protein
VAYVPGAGAAVVLIVALALWLFVRLSDGGKEGPE